MVAMETIMFYLHNNMQRDFTFKWKCLKIYNMKLLLYFLWIFVWVVMTINMYLNIISMLICVHEE